MRRWIDKFIEGILRTAIGFLGIFPLKLLYGLGAMLTCLLFFIWRKRRKIIIENLKLAFGHQINQREIKKLYQGIMVNVGKGFMETLKIRSLSDRFFNDNINVIGLDHLNDAMDQGKGVIAVSAHLGNFTLIGRKLAMLGYRFNYISRDPHSRWANEIFKWLRVREGVDFIPDKPKDLCLKKSLECLKNGEIIFIHIDISAISGGIYVDFFGYEVPTFKGPVMLAMRSGAPILPMFIVWEDGDKHKIIIESPIKLLRGDNLEEDIYKNTYHIVKITEDYIRRYPTQWWWVHRRWKRRRKKKSDSKDERNQ